MKEGSESPILTSHNIVTHSIEDCVPTVPDKRPNATEAEGLQNQSYKEVDVSPRVNKAVRTTKKDKAQGKETSTDIIRVQPKRKVFSL